MVGVDEKVIFVNATPPTAQSMPTLEFSLEGDRATAGQTAIVPQVRPASSFFTREGGAV